MNKKQKVLEALSAKKCLKLIAGINNFDKENVLKIVAAASQAGATCVDISAREDIVEEAISKYPEATICVSSVKPSELRRAIELGADMIELGNFEALYEEGIYYSAEEVLNLSKEIIEFAKGEALVSITVPGHLAIAEQIELAKKLEELNVDMIQTEGAAQVDATGEGALGQVQKVSLTLANTIELAKVLEKTFILTASGMNPDTVALATAAGAHGVGVGKYVNKQNTEIGMLAAAKALVDAVQSPKAEATVELVH